MIRWYRDGANLGGVYLFTAEVSEKVMAEYITPKCLCHEGILDWKSIDWLLNPDNTGVVDNVQIILEGLFNASEHSLWKAKYNGSVLSSCEYSEEKTQSATHKAT